MQFPNSLIEAIKDKKLVLFIGSGLSTAVGNLPNWTQLLTKLGQSCLGPGEQSALEKTLGFHRGHYFCGDFLEATLKDKLLELIKPLLVATPSQLETLRPIHKSIFQIVITTNYDSLIEDSEPNRGLAVFFNDQLAEVADAIRDKDKRFIFKTHISSTGQVILSLSSYHKLAGNPHYLALLQSLFLHFTVLFIGYGLDDHDFNYFYGTVAGLKSNTRYPHFVLVRPGQVNDVVRAAYKVHGLELLEGELPGFIQELAAKAEQSSKPALPTIDFANQNPTSFGIVKAGSIVGADWYVYHQGIGSAEILAEDTKVLHLVRDPDSPRYLSIKYPIGPTKIPRTRKIQLTVKGSGTFEFFALSQTADGLRYVALTSEENKSGQHSDGSHKYWFVNVERPNPTTYTVYTLDFESIPAEFRPAGDTVNLFLGVNQDLRLKEIKFAD